MNVHRFCNYNNTTGASSRTEQLTLSSLPGFNRVNVARSFVFCVVFGRSLFVCFLLTTVLSPLFWFTDSDYLFVSFKLFLHNKQGITFHILLCSKRYKFEVGDILIISRTFDLHVKAKTLWIPSNFIDHNHG
jgi:hypothetical protein